MQMREIVPSCTRRHKHYYKKGGGGVKPPLQRRADETNPWLRIDNLEIQGQINENLPKASLRRLSDSFSLFRGSHHQQK